jgi:hypothetical protein
MHGRRELLTAVGAAAVSLGVAGMVGVSPRRPKRQADLDALGLRRGARLHTCAVVDVRRATGGLTVHMRDTGGAPFELELLKHDPRTPGVAKGGSLAVYVRNHGNGATATNEEHGLAAMALARHLTERERAGAALPQLATMAKRGAGPRTPV